MCEKQPTLSIIILVRTSNTSTIFPPQQKIFGVSRSEDATKTFCSIRSFISTARKNALGAPQAIQRIFTGTPFVPISGASWLYCCAVVQWAPGCRRGALHP